MSRKENGSWIFEIFIQNNSQTGRESKQIGDTVEAIGCAWRIVISPMIPQGLRPHTILPCVIAGVFAGQSDRDVVHQPRH
jgi:hypothetical protein